MMVRRTTPIANKCKLSAISTLNNFEICFTYSHFVKFWHCFLYVCSFSQFYPFFQQVYNLRIVALKVRFSPWILTPKQVVLIDYPINIDIFFKPIQWENLTFENNIDEFPMQLYLSNSNTVFPVYLQLRHASEGERKALEGQPHSWE